MKELQDESTQIEFPLIAVQDAFRKVRKKFHLGVGELQAAIDAVQGGFGGTDSQALGLVLRSVWCHSDLDQLKWEIEWRMVVKAIVEQAKEQKPLNERSPSESSTEENPLEEIPPESIETVMPNLVRESAPVTPSVGFSPLPVQVPTLEQDLESLSCEAWVRWRGDRCPTGGDRCGV